MPKQDLTRDRILDAAMNSMLTLGFRRVTMDEIAQNLAMSKNTIYKHFQSKPQLAWEVFKRLKRQINQELLLIEEGNQNPSDIISKSIFFIQKQLSPWYERFWGDIKSEVPELYDDFVRFRNEKITGIKNLVEKGIKTGKFRKINSAVAVRVYLGAVDQVLNPEFLHNEKISFPEAINSIMDIWSLGIVNKGRSDA